MAPDRAGPSRVVDRSGDDMQVKLPHDVAERADVDLVRAGMGLEKACRRRRLFDQLAPVRRLARSVSSTTPPRRGTRMSQGQRASFINRTRVSVISPTMNASAASLASSAKLMAPVKWRSRGTKPRRSSQVPAEERDRADGERGARRVVALAVVAIEPVVGVIDMDLDLRMGGGDLFYPGDGDVLVVVAEMQERWHARPQVLEADDAAAVVADRGAQARKLRSRAQATVPPRQKPTTATLPPSLATSTAAATSRSICSRSTLPMIAMPRALDFGIISDVEPFLDVLEYRRGDRKIALGRELVGDRPDMSVDAEDLLHHHHAAARASARIGAPGSDGSRSFRFQFNPGHFNLLPFERSSMRRAARATLGDGRSGTASRAVVRPLD